MIKFICELAHFEGFTIYIDSIDLVHILLSVAGVDYQNHLKDEVLEISLDLCLENLNLVFNYIALVGFELRIYNCYFVTFLEKAHLQELLPVFQIFIALR